MIKNTFKVKTVGEILKEARMAKNMEIREVSEIIKIRPQYLEALENGDYEIFTSEVYLKGFLKNYSKFLGVDKERALALYRRENKLKDGPIVKNTGFVRESKGNFSLTPDKIIVAIIIVIAATIVYYLASQVSTVLQAPELSIDAPIVVEADSVGEYTTEETEITISGKISPEATLQLNGDNVATNNLETFEINEVSLDVGINEFVLVAESEFGREVTTRLVVTRLQTEPDTLEPTESEAEAVEPEITQMDISLEIGPNQANVLVIIDGEQQANRVFGPEDSPTFAAQESLTVRTPRPSEVKVIINGETYDITNADDQTWELQEGEVVKTP